MTFYAFYAFYAWWFHFPQSGALAEGTSRQMSHKHDRDSWTLTERYCQASSDVLT
jgi:hypothetical protein